LCSVLCCFYQRLSFCPFAHCSNVCLSIYRFWLPLCYFQTCLTSS
jgi:hypothetical protein